MPVKKLKTFLDGHDIRYVSISHSPAYSAQAIAEVAHTFGNLYDLDVYVAEQLTEDEEIAFSAGSHTEVVRMSYQDFDRLVMPKVTALT